MTYGSYFSLFIKLHLTLIASIKGTEMSERFYGYENRLVYTVCNGFVIMGLLPPYYPY